VLWAQQLLRSHKRKTPAGMTGAFNLLPCRASASSAAAAAATTTATTATAATTPVSEAATFLARTGFVDRQ
jgi:hypothetical protein